MENGNSEISPKSLGNVLRAAREAAGLTPDSLANETKLKVEVIQALESDQFENLPPVPYLKSFLITLSKILGTDSGELIHLLKKQTGEKDESPFAQNSEDKVDLSQSTSRKPLFSIVLAFIVVVLLAWLLINLKDLGAPPVQELGLLPQDTLQDTLPGLTEMESLTEDSSDISESVSSNFPKDIKDSGSTSTAPKPQIIPDPPKSKSSPEPGQPLEPAIPQTQIPPPKSSSLKKDSLVSPEPNRPQYLVFECTADSLWINVKRNGWKEINKLLKLGESMTLTKTDSMELTTGVPGALKFKLKGREYHPDGNLIKIIKGKLLSP